MNTFAFCFFVQHAFGIIEDLMSDKTDLFLYLLAISVKGNIDAWNFFQDILVWRNVESAFIASSTFLNVTFLCRWTLIWTVNKS